MSRHSLYLCLSLTCLVFLTGCLPNQVLTRSGALNTVSIELSDEDITYQQLSNSFDITSLGGFLDVQPDENFKSKSSTVINNNGIQTRSTVTGQAGFLKALTLIASSLQLSALAMEAFPDAENRIALFLPSLLVSVPLNEGIWRPFNRQQVHGITMNRLIEENPNAHFYSFPNSNISETTRLLGTSWEGQNYIVAGTISDQIVQGNNDLSLPHQSDEDADYRMGASKSTTAASMFDPATVQVGSSGTYQASKKESYPFTVIEIQDETDDDKIIRIEYAEASGEKRQKLTKASNSRLTFKR